MNGLLWVDCSSSCMLASQSSGACISVFKTLWIPCIRTRRSFFLPLGPVQWNKSSENIELDMDS